MTPNSSDSSPRRSRRIAATDGAMALIVVLLITQVWLLSATLDSFLAGHRDVAIPAAIASGLLFGACAVLYRFVVRLDRRN